MTVRCAICGNGFQQPELYAKHYEKDHSDFGRNSGYPSEDVWLYRILRYTEKRDH